MKKVKIIAMLMLFVLALTACTTPQPAKSTATAYGLQFEVEEDWVVEEVEGFTYVYFSESETNYLVFMQPTAVTSEIVVDEETVTYLVEMFAMIAGGEAPEVTVTELTIDGRTVYSSEAEIIVNNAVFAKVAIWMCVDNSNSYMWMYLEGPDTYDQYYSNVKALTESIVFVGE